MSVHPEVLWAQRSSDSDSKKNIIYLTVNLPDIKPDTLQYDLTADKVSFKAVSSSGGSDREYAFELPLFGEVIPEESIKNLTTRHFAAVLRKKETKAEYWPRLTKDKVRLQYVKTDFSKWVDEDEQEGDKAALDDDFDMGGMGGMGGMPGMGGMGGMGGMDMDQLMKSMGGAGGAGGGAGAFDPSSLDEGKDDDDDDDDGPPPLENVQS
ncbi:heat shock protein HSP20-like chaperone [Ceratobasidium sp. AG-Ba]|nr:heat shock protein HSP20-like chaperone [Ceratobasidium sp. AG-Ba]QRV91709.1 heat shock protein HSP20-like chaperone [Ceratobasidium sp. AG-Ba]